VKKAQPVENPSPSILEKDSLQILRDALYTLEAGFSNLPPAAAVVPDYKAIKRVVLEAAERLRDNYPYFLAPRAARVSQACETARRIFAEAERRQLYLALADLPVRFFDLPAAMEPDCDTITCLRSVLMKPEHREWIDTIWSILDQAADAALQRKSST
jgi:hypothetical protein